MSVYVDDMYKSPIGQFGRMKMSHLYADTSEELLAMVDRIGVARRWIQFPGTHKEHFDIAMSKRARAVEAGAIEVVYGEHEWPMMKTRPCAKRPAVPIPPASATPQEKE